MVNSGKIEKLCPYTAQENWTDVVPASVNSFYIEFKVYPNILYANSSVLKNLLQQCIEDGIIENYDPLTQEEPLILGGYISHEYALEYVPDDRLTEYQFLLVYDQSSNV